MRRNLILFLIFGLALGGVVPGVGLWAVRSFQATGPLAQDRTLIIERGSGTKSIARQLQQASVIDNSLIFQLGARWLSGREPMKAGEYLFARHISAAAAVRLLQSGKTVVRRVTLAEGLTTAEIVDLLVQTDGLTGSISPVPAEGALLPETYHFSYGDSRQQLIDRMTTARDKLLHTLWSGRAADLPLDTPEQAVILASVVEKETGQADERAKVAAVFLNRLRRNMRLQSDPTVAYGITVGRVPLGRSLSRDDLKTATPFNTYIVKGLPPAPIANPGREAIRAVLHPADSTDLYFVADGSGGHVFARTLAQHNRNVARWRKFLRQRQNGN